MNENTLPHPDIMPGLGITKTAVMNVVSRHHKLSISDLYRRTKETKIVEPRHIVISLLKYALGFTNEDIAFEFDQTNATIVHARDNVKNFYETDRTYKEKIDTILDQLFYVEDERKEILNRMLKPNMDKYKTGGRGRKTYFETTV